MNSYNSGSLIADRYEVVGDPLLGGMGIVYLCWDQIEKRPVALKTFKSEYLSNRNGRSGFLQEGSIWIQLGKHSNIVQCYQIQPINKTGEIFFILELIHKSKGKTDASLRSWLIPGIPLTIDQSLLFSIQIVRGMKYAVSTIPGLIHRDLKPENLLIGSDKILGGKINSLHITDFGLAALLEGAFREGTELYSTKKQYPINGINHHTIPLSDIVGTPLYMAPEQWSNQEIGIHTDIFTFGCIFYEMLTGNTYLFGRNIEQIKSLCCSPRSTDILKDLPHPIQEILERCLALPPHQRFNHWEELETSLETAYSTLMKHKIPGEDKFGLKGDGQEINLINSFYALAFQYIHIGKYGEARSKIKTAIIKSRKLKLRTPEIIGELYLGDLATYQGNYDQANANYTKALSYFRRKEDVHGITLSLRRLGAAYTSQGDYDKAIDYIKQAIDLSAEQIDIVGSMKDLQDLGTLLKYKGETTSAIQCYEKSLKIAKSIGNKSGEANAIMFLGIIHKNQGNFYKALDFHSTALKIFLEIGFRSGEMEALTNLGVTYKNIGENYKAVECYEDALSISQELGEKRTEGGILFNLGRIYFILREFDLSLTYMNEALNISTAIGNKHLEASTTGCIGNLHSIQGNYRSAKLAYEKAIQIAQETGDIGVVADNCFDLAILLANLREFTEAEYNAELAAQIWLKTNNFRYQQAIHFIKEIQRYY